MQWSWGWALGWGNWRVKLKFFWIERTECGCNVPKLNGQYKETVTHDFFIAKQPTGTGKILFTSLGIRMGNGVQTTRKWQILSSNTTKNFSPLLIPCFLKKFCWPLKLGLVHKWMRSYQLISRLGKYMKQWNRWPLSRHRVRIECPQSFSNTFGHWLVMR